MYISRCPYVFAYKFYTRVFRQRADPELSKRIVNVIRSKKDQRTCLNGNFMPKWMKRSHWKRWKRPIINRWIYNAWTLLNEPISIILRICLFFPKQKKGPELLVNILYIKKYKFTLSWNFIQIHLLQKYNIINIFSFIIFIVKIFDEFLINSLLWKYFR